MNDKNPVGSLNVISSNRLSAERALSCVRVWGNEKGNAPNDFGSEGFEFTFFAWLETGWITASYNLNSFRRVIGARTLVSEIKSCPLPFFLPRSNDGNCRIVLISSSFFTSSFSSTAPYK